MLLIELGIKDFIAGENPANALTRADSVPSLASCYEYITVYGVPTTLYRVLCTITTFYLVKYMVYSVESSSFVLCTVPSAHSR